jgi:hypothetical protein
MKPKNPAAVALGALGGAAKTKAKAEAARKNGALGGRPKTRKPKKLQTINRKSK